MKQLFIILLTFLVIQTKAQQLKVYPVPKEVVYSLHNDDYTVRVRMPEGEWQDLYEYNVVVDMDSKSNASMVYFDMEGTVEVAIQKNNGNFKEVKVRPSNLQIPTKTINNVVYFTLNHPQNISIEFDGDKLHNLHLFANSIEKNIPDSKNPNVVYFGPGVHQPKEKDKGVFKIKSNQTVYIDGSAILKGKLLCDSVENVKIEGRGILLQPERGFEITNSKNVSVEGIIIINPKHYTVYGGASQQLNIENIKSFSAQGWSDGIDLMSCSDVKINGIFMRNSDDCIAIYAHRWDYYGNAENYKITNSTLWADIAHPINIGLHGDTSHEGDTIQNLHFKNIDILEHDEDDPDYQGAIAFSVGDLNLVRNVTFEDIRVDNFQEGKLFSIRCFYNQKYNTGPGRGVENVLFKNITYTGNNLSKSVINGFDKNYLIKNITFENLKINGKKIESAKEGNFKIGGFAKGIVFK